MFNFGANKNLQKKVNELSTMVTTLTTIASGPRARKSTDVKYTTRNSQIDAMRLKYKGLDVLGNQITQRLVNLRVALSVPNRLFLVPNTYSTVIDTVADKAKTDVKAFLTEFMRINSLDNSLPRDLAKEAELQGQVALRLIWDEDAKVPRVKYYPWNSTGYVVTPKDQYLINSKCKLQYTALTGEVVIEDDDFVFISFNDELMEYIGFPTCGPILQTIENLDSDLIDWRQLNHLFAHPTPHFKCETKDDAEAISAMISATGWKVGTAIATNSEFLLKGTTGVEANLLLLSITTNAKIISGHTGVAIHFLGFANVMSNRSTADSMSEPTEVVLHSEITSWNAFYIELFNKAIRMRNSKLNGALPEDVYLPKIVPLTDKQWNIVKDLYMPLHSSGLLSKGTLLENLPGIDAEVEEEKINEEAAKLSEKSNKLGNKLGSKAPDAKKSIEDNAVEDEEEDEE